MKIRSGIVYQAVLFGCLVIPLQSQGQVLISLLLGDKLNTGQVEFGLDGGASIVSQSQGGGGRGTFNLGFYFDIKTKHPSWMVHTGVIVKSTMGAGHLPVYTLGDAQLDAQFANGYVDRTMNYFNVPVMMKYKLKNHFYFEGGIQLGLKYGVTDKFITEINGQDLTYEVDANSKFRALDAGLAGGIGYRFMKGNGLNLAIRYYSGMMNVAKEGDEVFNRSWYFNIGIPIGAGKAREKQGRK